MPCCRAAAVNAMVSTASVGNGIAYCVAACLRSKNRGIASATADGTAGLRDAGGSGLELLVAGDGIFEIEEHALIAERLPEG